MFLVLLGSTSALAQTSEVVRGIVLVSNGDHATGASVLEGALVDPGLIKPALLPKAWYHLGLARSGLARAGEPGLWVGALEAFARCSAEGQRYAADCAGGVERSMHEVFNAAVGAATRGTPESLGEAGALCAHLTRLQPDDWFGALCSVNANLESAPRPTSWAAAEAAWSSYQAGAGPDRPGSAGLLLQVLTKLRVGQLGLEATIPLTAEARAVLERRAGTQGLPDSLRDELDELESGLRSTKTELDAAKAAAEAPGATFVDCVRYAGALEQLRRPEATAAHEACTSRHPSEAGAWFARGVLHYNRASAAVGAPGQLAELALSRPHLERALALKPGDPEILDVLILVTGYLGDPAATARYRELREVP